MKIFVWALDLIGNEFLYLSEMFGNTSSDANISAGVFVETQIWQMMNDEALPTIFHKRGKSQCGGA